MKPARVLTVAALSLLLSSKAHAEDASAAPASAPPRASFVQLHIDGAAGLTTAGVLLGGIGLARFGLFEVGGAYGTSGLFSTRTGGGLAIGAGRHRPGGGGFDVLLELGMNEHHVEGDGGLLSSDPGATGTIPYGGVRAGVDWSFGAPAAVVHPTLGLWLFARADLAASEASYTYYDTGLVSDRSDRAQTRQGSVTVGGGGEVGLALAGGFDLLP